MVLSSVQIGVECIHSKGDNRHEDQDIAEGEDVLGKHLETDSAPYLGMEEREGLLGLSIAHKFEGDTASCCFFLHNLLL